jgi:hypothetical protein
MADCITAGERYICASTTSDMRMHEYPCDADKLLAAGYASRGDARKMLGLRLYRMQNTADRDSVGTVIEQAHAWLQGRMSRKGNRPLPLAQSNALIVQTLQWWLAQRCTYCNGIGFDIIEGTPALSQFECAACRGTGITPLKRVVPSRLLEHAAWLTHEWDVLCAAVIGDLAQQINSGMTLGNR